VEAHDDKPSLTHVSQLGGQNNESKSDAVMQHSTPHHLLGTNSYQKLDGIRGEGVGYI
jgi:hypothetical protein